MKLEVVQELVEAGRDIGMDVTHCQEYSGRGMYGKKTEAVIFNEHADLAVIAAVAVRRIMERGADDSALTVDELVKDLRRARTDQMGFSLIAY